MLYNLYTGSVLNHTQEKYGYRFIFIVKGRMCEALPEVLSHIDLANVQSFQFPFKVFW
jgi:hypothetical protein